MTPKVQYKLFQNGKGDKILKTINMNKALITVNKIPFLTTKSVLVVHA